MENEKKILTGKKQKNTERDEADFGFQQYELKLSQQTSVIQELRKQLKEMKTGRKQLEISETRFRVLVNSSEDIIYTCNLDGIITFANQKFCQEVNASEEKILGKEITQFLHLDQMNMGWNNALADVLKTNHSIRIEYEYALDDGSIRYFEVTLSPIVGLNKKIFGVIGTHHEITKLKENVHKAISLAYHDSLIGLPNKLLFLDRLQTSIFISKRNETKAVVLFVDLDDFKKINNHLGYLHGDKLIIEIAHKLGSCTREYDTVARLSEDKFLLLFLNIQHANEIFPIIERINTVLEEPFRIGETEYKITASIGVAVYPDDGSIAEEILLKADEAMHQAKEQGKNRCHFYNENIEELIRRRSALAKSLKEAVDKREFVLHYQPQYEAGSRKLRGFEALIRWNNPEMGLVMPAEFLPVAEQTGSIVPIGNWVLETACKKCQQIKTEYGYNPIMSVNISEIQLKRIDFPFFVRNVIKQTGIDPSNLELEIKESSILSDFEQIVDILGDLHEIGVRIALDDYGAGNLSVGNLKKLPIDMVKIEKGIIGEINQKEPQSPVTDSLISAVQKLNIEMLAKGVDTREQLDYLIRKRCDSIQGYYFTEPVPEDKLESIIKLGILENEALGRLIHKAGLTYEGLSKQKAYETGKRWEARW